MGFDLVSLMLLKSKEEDYVQNFITMTKLRTIIRLYEDRMGLKTIAVMARTSRNTVKKYIHAWNSLKMGFDEFQSKSDTELHDLFCISDLPSKPNPRWDILENLLWFYAGKIKLKMLIS